MANKAKLTPKSRPVFSFPDDSNNIGRPLDGDGPASGNGTQPRAGFPVDDEIPRLHDPDKAEIAFIKPKKILGKPLHATDVLYEGKIIDTGRWIFQIVF